MIDKGFLAFFLGYDPLFIIHSRENFVENSLKQRLLSSVRNTTVGLWTLITIIFKRLAGIAILICISFLPTLLIYVCVIYFSNLCMYLMMSDITREPNFTCLFSTPWILHFKCVVYAMELTVLLYLKMRPLPYN